MEMVLGEQPVSNQWSPGDEAVTDSESQTRFLCRGPQMQVSKGERM